MAYDAETRDQLIETVRRFVAERLRPIEAQVAEQDAVPDDVLEEMRELGLFGLSIPEEYGGLDLSMEDECLVAIELGRTQPGLPFRLRHQCRHRQPGPRHVRHRGAEAPSGCRSIATGEIVTSFALTEPEAGSDSAVGADPRRARRRCLRAQRHQAIHHQRQPGRPLHGDGPHRSRRRRARSGVSRLPGAARPAGPHRSASPRRRWASRARTSATSSSTMSACRRRTAWAARARASRWRCRCSTAAACISPPSAWASPSA